ncbi:ArsR/SmtB family transcription factor [Pseudarthrobacter sp. S6]|uniref:ArsR/SmtB family transcription factor n=1 Tax=Pseudarthrobacter sp. S6 TaxID=3418420 RepID=UPI003CF6A1C2
MTPTGVACCCRPVYSSRSFTIPQVVVSMPSILMNRTRSRIIRFLLRNGPSTCSEIGSALGLSSPAVRRHVVMLHRAGLVERMSVAGFTARPDQVREHIEALAVGLTGEVKQIR